MLRRNPVTARGGWDLAENVFVARRNPLPGRSYDLITHRGIRGMLMRRVEHGVHA